MLFNVIVNYVYYVQRKITQVTPDPIEVYKETHVNKNEKFVSEYAQNKYVSE
jgi:hypothetical protein